MHQIRIVDVFSATPFRGNPVAVILEADGLSDARMQAIAAWTNLSETTFHLRPVAPDADYRLRIFTPRGELPFAGHPTLGSAHALIEAGLVTPTNGRVMQECQIGLVPVTIRREADTGQLSFDLPDARFRDLTEAETARLAQILGSAPSPGRPPALVDVGPRWIVAEMPNAQTVLAMTPDLAASAAFETGLEATGVTVFGRYRPADPAEIEVRSFAPSCGVAEDPVCGSGNGAVAAYRLRGGDLPRTGGYIATQGRCVGRDGRIDIRIDDGRIGVGGAAITTLTGSLRD